MKKLKLMKEIKNNFHYKKRKNKSKVYENIIKVIYKILMKITKELFCNKRLNSFYNLNTF